MKKIVVFINAIRPITLEAIAKFKAKTGTEITPVVFVELKIMDRILKRNAQNSVLDKISFVSVDFDSEASIRKALKAIDGEIITVVSQFENSMHEYQKLLPYLPYLPLPNETTITWATEKKFMRDLVGAYDATLVPKYVEVHEKSDLPIIGDGTGMNFPVIVKPSGLEGSLLVTKADDQVQLEQAVIKAFDHIEDAYGTWIKRQKPFLLIEEFMEGDMYSIDAYIDHAGTATCLPIVQVQTGHSKGLEDFYGYSRITPANIEPTEEADAQAAVQKTVEALGLRSITVHVELMSTQSGWKLIEIGPRIGGYRHNMYDKAWGINHIVNDIIHRTGQSITLPTNNIGFSCVLNIYADSEGTIAEIVGLSEISTLSSVVSIKQNLSENDTAVFARHNGDPIFEIELFNIDRDALDADISFIEKSIAVRIAE